MLFGLGFRGLCTRGQGLSDHEACERRLIRLREIMLNLKIAILAPPLDEKSAGIVALHRLYAELKIVDPETILLLYLGIGNNFSVALPDAKNIPPEELKSYYPETIFVVPEVLCASRLKDLRVARYYLNRIGAIAPAEADLENEFAITFHEGYCDRPFFYLPQYLGKFDIPDNFQSMQNSRIINCTYFGKSTGRYEEVSPLPTSILITRSWPESSDQYKQLLNISDYFFSFDALSSSNVDALMSGNKLVILDFFPNDESFFRKNFPDQPYLTAENYSSQEALDEYAERCNQWFQGLRETRNNFSILVDILHDSMTQFFSKDHKN